MSPAYNSVEASCKGEKSLNVQISSEKRHPSAEPKLATVQGIQNARGTNRKIGLALSGGTLKAAAHVGVLQALENVGIHPDCVAGTSAGSYVSALYAHGCLPSELVRMVDEFPGAHLLDYGFPLWSYAWGLCITKIPFLSRKTMNLPSGLLRGDRLEQYFREHLSNRQPEIPYYIIATDLYTGAPIVYGDMSRFGRTGSPGTNKGRAVEPVEDIAKVIRGSCSLPGILTPVQLGDKLLVDGGLRSYVPVEVLRDIGCTHIIAVNLYRLKGQWQPTTFVEVLSRSFDILLQETIDGDVKGTDVLSITPNVSDVSFLSFDDMKRCVFSGQKAVVQKEAQLKEFLRKAKNE